MWMKPVGGLTLSSWLWVFTNREATVYTIADNRSSDVVVEMLGEKFPGILASDGFRPMTNGAERVVDRSAWHIEI
jgi:hypothetical protein